MYQRKTTQQAEWLPRAPLPPLREKGTKKEKVATETAAALKAHQWRVKLHGEAKGKGVPWQAQRLFAEVEARMQRQQGASEREAGGDDASRTRATQAYQLRLLYTNRFKHVSL